MLIAISLEVCGCELARDEPRPFSYLGVGHAMPRPLLAEQRLSFYDPVDPAGQTPSQRSSAEVFPPVRPPLHEAKPLPWAIPESVYFVYKGGDSHPDDLAYPGRQPVATAFVLSVPDREHRRFVRFLVTARHVVDPEWARCSERNPASINLRLNRRSGGIAYVSISLLSRAMRRFLTPSDPTADLAIIPLDQGLITNMDEYKFIDVPFRLLPTDSEALQFHPGQPVTTARIPSWPPSGSSSFPVFDAGVLAKLPTEPVTVQCGNEFGREPSKPIHMWLINAGTPRGASGAPVYTAIARDTGTAKSSVLLGVQSVAWPDEGVAGITPSIVLRDLVQSALRREKHDMDFYTGPNP